MHHDATSKSLRVENLAVDLTMGAKDPRLPETLRTLVAARLGLSVMQVPMPKIVQRAIDARNRKPRFSYTVDVTLNGTLARRLVARNKGRLVSPLATVRMVLPRIPDGPRPVVVGAGPAGLFAALTLAEAGWAPIVVERGKPVERRSKDVSSLYARGVLDEDSNVCFGEGGAGTYSDGKLYTRVGDHRIDSIMRQLVQFGANSDILCNNRPHVGTDKLVGILQQLRAHLSLLGTTFMFDTALKDLVHNNGKLEGVLLRDGATLPTQALLLATGHSAREVWHRLEAAQVRPIARPFAMGFRIEHPQALIDEARYGEQVARKKLLPAADYKLTYNEVDCKSSAHRGVFSFCMCPGGVVVTTPTTPDALCINGMSHASRQGRFANSAVVVSVGPQDFADAGYAGTYAGANLQQSVEKAAYAMGGGQFVAPACRVSDFLAQKVSQDLPATSYRRGLVAAPIWQLYGSNITTALGRALRQFDRRIKGFVSQEALLIGVETRTAAPLRVPRGEDGMALGLIGLYPAGEGMGYGGGIVSAAVDGVRAAQKMLQNAGAQATQAYEHVNHLA